MRELLDKPMAAWVLSALGMPAAIYRLMNRRSINLSTGDSNQDGTYENATPHTTTTSLALELKRILKKFLTGSDSITPTSCCRYHKVQSGQLLGVYDFNGPSSAEALWELSVLSNTAWLNVGDTNYS